MKLFVAAIPGSKINQVDRFDDCHCRGRLNAPADDGRANEALLQVLADYLGCSQSRLTLLSGRRSRQKIVGFREL
jgi:uncharacterized protein YggU (UPF0235/DUF167 family)